jgi:DNA-binding CsgD family transcriptional regulator
MWIVETHVRGLVHRIRGEWDAAWVSFKMTHDAARRVGFLWRATLALIELDATPHARKPRGDSYLQAAALLVRDNFPRSFLARRLGRWMNVYRDPVAKGLAPQPRQVLRHLLAAKSTDEIARTMSIGEGTVRNYIKELFRRFEVRSREELLVACYERGMGSPLWWDTLDKPNPPSIAGARPFVPPGAARRPRRS